MSAGLHKFILEWGPVTVSVILLIGGYFYAWVYCLGRPSQKFILYIALISLMLSWLVLEANNIRPHDPVEIRTRGQLTQRLLCPVLSMLAGIGLFSWFNPEKWRDTASERKYQRELKKLK